jgi:type VI secretion system ImpM family protein
MTLQLRGTGYFGKVPVAGDFQRLLTPAGPDARTLDWFHDGWARYALAGKRPELVGTTGFCWQRPGSDVALLGVMTASRDRTGRRFPLLVFGAVAGVDSTAELIASAHEFLAGAEAVAESGRAGVDLVALRGHVDSLRTRLDTEGNNRQVAWNDSTTAAEWAGGTDALVLRLRALDYAFSSGGRPNFVLRGRWQGDLRHFTAGLGLLQRLGQQAPAMLFWSQDEGAVSWRVAFEHAVPSQFESLLWHAVDSPTVFDTEPGAVPVPTEFVGRDHPGGDTRLASLVRAS